MQQEPLPGTHLPLLRLIGQVASTYLVAEGPDGLYLIDQHAAHERVLFDQMMAQYRASMIPSQKFIESVPVELSPEKAGILEANLETMASLGFEIEPFGPNTFLIRSIPMIVDRGDPKDAILAVVDAFEEDETPLENEAQAKIAARVCKGMAVKGGQALSEAEQRNLLLNLEASQSPRTCPHGRPTMIHLSANLLERQFGRRGAR
jgi:DNA mismatch repair protein MutL